MGPAKNCLFFCLSSRIQAKFVLDSSGFQISSGFPVDSTKKWTGRGEYNTVRGMVRMGAHSCLDDARTNVPYYMSTGTLLVCYTEYEYERPSTLTYGVRVLLLVEG